MRSRRLAPPLPLAALLVSVGCASTPGTDNGVVGDAAPSAAPPTEEATEVEVAPTNMIDDLEDGDDEILAQEGRGGSWFTYNDGTADAIQSPEGTFQPSDGGYGESAFAARTWGSGFLEWGAGMGFEFNSTGEPASGAGTKGFYDASAHEGIVLRAKGNASVRASLVTMGVLPEDRGGSCVPTADSYDCEDGHGIAMSLSEDWQQFRLPFAELTQIGWGQPLALDVTQIVALHFQVEQGNDFDFWIDEVGFY